MVDASRRIMERQSNQVLEPKERLRRVLRTRNALLRDRGGDPSKAEEILAGYAAALSVWLESKMPEFILSNERELTGQITQIGGTLVRTLTTLGIKRIPRDALTLDAYLKEKTRETED